MVKCDQELCTTDYRHARHIPDDVFLDAIRTARGNWARDWAMVADVQAVLGGLPIDRSTYYGDVPGVPRKVVIAKAKRLIARGVMRGCTCGCRGDFEILESSGVTP